MKPQQKYLSPLTDRIGGEREQKQMINKSVHSKHYISLNNSILKEYMKALTTWLINDR
jgi:hypothetical protein